MTRGKVDFSRDSIAKSPCWRQVSNLWPSNQNLLRFAAVDSSHAWIFVLPLGRSFGRAGDLLRPLLRHLLLPARHPVLPRHQGEEVPELRRHLLVEDSDGGALKDLSFSRDLFYKTFWSVIFRFVEQNDNILFWLVTKAFIYFLRCRCVG